MTFEDALAELKRVTDAALRPDTFICAKEILRRYPQVPDRKWIYNRAARLGVTKVAGKRRVLFSLRAVQRLLGPGTRA